MAAYALGVLQAEKASAPVESEHSKSTPAPVGPNVNCGAGSVVGSVGPVLRNTLGPTVSMVIASGSDFALSLPPEGICVNVTLWWPSARLVEPSVQLPFAAAVPVLTSASSTYRRICALPAPWPTNVGVVTLVTRSRLEVPESLPAASCGFASAETTVLM